MDVIEIAQDKMGKTISVLKRDLGSLRAGRASRRLPITITNYKLPLWVGGRCFFYFILSLNNIYYNI